MKRIYIYYIIAISVLSGVVYYFFRRNAIKSINKNSDSNKVSLKKDITSRAVGIVNSAKKIIKDTTTIGNSFSPYSSQQAKDDAEISKDRQLILKKAVDDIRKDLSSTSSLFLIRNESVYETIASSKNNEVNFASRIYKDKYGSDMYNDIYRVEFKNTTLKNKILTKILVSA